MLDTDSRPLTVVYEGAAIQRCGSITLHPGVPTDVPMSFLEEFGWIRGLRFDFARLGENFRSRTDDGRPHLDFWCPMSGVDGYGRHALSIYQGLLPLAGVTLRESWITSQWSENHVGAEIQDAVREGYRRLPAKVGVCMSLPYDPKGYDHGSPVRIWITQFETDHMPREHVRQINKADHLIVTSRFQVEVMRNSGIRIPISVLTSGVDTDYFTYQEREVTDLFGVLIIGALTERKNPLGAIRIFQKAAQGHPRWRLTIKTRHASGIDEVQAMAANDPRIEVLIGDTHPARVIEYYHNHDCLLWPSKGEGCGLPPLEAMATGMEVVCSDNSGMRDFVSDKWCYPIRSNGMEPAGWPVRPGGFSRQYVEQYGEVGNWWTVDENHAADQLQRCYNNWLAGKGKGKKAAEYVRKERTLTHQAQSVLDVVEKYLD